MMALTDIESGRIETGISRLIEASKINNIYAQYYLAVCYEKGLGSNKDANKAFMLYRKAAERGLPEAMIKLAECYDNGIGVQINYTRASEWTKRYYMKGGKINLPDIEKLYAEGKQKSEHLYAEEQTEIDNIDNDVPISKENKGVKKPSITVNINNPTNASTITAEYGDSVRLSEIDQFIPYVNISNPNLFALIIANENYQEAVKVDNALNDGDIVAKYFELTLGIPKEHIHLIKDATLNNIKKELKLMTEISEAFNGDASILVYYAGHGIPDEKTKDPYIIPVDGYCADMSTCVSLKDFYEQLGNSKFKKSIVFIDACFSGATRGNGNLTAARGISLKPKKTFPVGNMVIFTSSSGDETSFSYKAENHGMFTFYLLKALKENKGNISLGDLVKVVTDNVIKESLVINGKRQTPTVIPSDNVLELWSEWTLQNLK